MKNCEFVWESVEKFFFLVAIDVAVGLVGLHVLRVIETVGWW